MAAANILTNSEQMAFLHVTSEVIRVQKAVSAMREGDIAAFGELLVASHTSLRDQLRVSSPAMESASAFIHWRASIDGSRRSDPSPTGAP